MKFPGQMTLTSFSILIWFHGRGISNGVRCLVYYVKSGDWDFDGVGFYVNYDGNHAFNLLVSDGINDNHVLSTDETVDYDRWTHLAATYHHGEGNF